jgi:phage shock protein A
MSLLGKMRAALSRGASAILDAATDPKQEIEALMLELREHMRAATTELIEYKGTEKRLAARRDELTARVATTQARAETAVRAGQDDLAREALVEAQRLAAEAAQADRERAEMATYAAELLRGRREVERRLKELELRKGTLAQDLAVARGGSRAVAAQGAPGDALARAEEAIAKDAILAELDAELGDPLTSGDAAVEARFREKMKEAQAEVELAALKKKLGPRP